jgi:hypothetical protein
MQASDAARSVAPKGHHSPVTVHGKLVAAASVSTGRRETFRAANLAAIAHRLGVLAAPFLRGAVAGSFADLSQGMGVSRVRRISHR